MTSPAPLVLRPLNIGEIFDRAVTMYVQNFVVFSLMLLTVLVPIGIAQYAFAGNSQVADIQKAIQTIENPASAAKQRAANPNPFPYTGTQLAGLMAIFLIALLVSPVATNAVAIGVASLYAGKRPEFDTCFRQALRSWLPLLGTIILFGLMGMGVYIGGVIVLVIVVGIGATMVNAFLFGAVIMFILAAIAFIALLALLVVMVLGGYFALFAVSIEGKGVMDAIGSGLRRVFHGGEFRRAILMSLAYLALELGVGTIAGIVGLALIFFVKNPALQIAFTTVINAALSGFVTVLVAVYYYDVRVRQEGYDLEADLVRLGVTEASPATP